MNKKNKKRTNAQRPVQKKNKKTELPEKVENVVPAENVEKVSKLYLKKEYLILVAISLIIFIILRNLFPVPNYLPDSRAYLFASLNGEQFGMRPLGYSRFVALVSRLSMSLPSIAWAQFVLHVICCLFFTNTIVRFKGFNTLWAFWLVSIASTANISLIYIANTVSSDSLFISLTILFVAFMIRFIYESKYIWIISAALVLYFSYNVRFSALYYPIIGIISILLFIPKRQLLKKTVGVLLFIAGFIYFYQDRLALSEERLGEPIFSAFSGHQMANNAFEIYKHQPDKLLNSNDNTLKMLEGWNITLVDSLNKNPKLKDSVINDFGIYELWAANGMDAKYCKYIETTRKTPSFEAWNFAAAGLNDFGSGYIKKYFGGYLRYYIFPNIIMLYKPYLEMNGTYLPNTEFLFESIKTSFNVPEIGYNKNESMVTYLQMPSFILYGLCLILFLPALFIYLFKKQWKYLSIENNRIIWFLGLFNLATCGFLVIAAPIVYRYVVFLPMLMIPFEWLIISANFKKNIVQK